MGVFCYKGFFVCLCRTVRYVIPTFNYPILDTYIHPFIRLSFQQAIYKCTDDIKALLRSKFDPAPPLWLVTRGVFMGQIVPAQVCVSIG